MDKKDSREEKMDDMDDIDESKGWVFDTSKLESPKLVWGRLEWTPPPHLDLSQVEIVKESIRLFNAGIERGDHEIKVNDQSELEIII